MTRLMGWLLLSLLSLPAQAQEDCGLIEFMQGQKVSTVRGSAPADGVVCFTFAARADQMASVRINGPNVIIYVVDFGEGRKSWRFKAKERNKLIVGQLIPAASPSPFRMTVTLK